MQLRGQADMVQQVPSRLSPSGDKQVDNYTRVILRYL